jgi:hypothetical protein
MRTLLVPWNPACLLFIAISTALLAFFRNTGVLGVVGSYFLLSWLFKYAFVMLEHVANGRFEAPVVSVDMLGPFEQRPMILIAWCVLMFLAAWKVGNAAGAGLVVAVLLLLPATAAILGLGWGFLQSINPPTLWRMIRGLGIHYVGILGLMAAAAGLIRILGLSDSWDAWNMASIAVAEVALLTVFSVLGGALFARRLQVGHEPTVSPERKLAQEDREHSVRLNAMLDEFYTQARLRKHELALGILRQWFAQADDRYVATDAQTIMARIATWQDPSILSRASRIFIEELDQRGNSAAVAEIRRATPDSTH